MANMYRVLSVLLALIMASGVAPAQESWQGHLVISDITLAFDGEQHGLDSELHFGFSIDQKPGGITDEIMEFSMDLAGEKLFPVQYMMGTKKGGVLLYENADQAVGVTIETLEAALGMSLSGMDSEEYRKEQMETLFEGDEDMAFLMGTLIPAYGEMLQAVQNPRVQEKMQQAVFDAMLAQCEPTPEPAETAFEVNGQTWQGLKISMELSFRQLYEAEKAAMQVEPAAAKFLELFESYYLDKLAPEAGLSGLESLGDLADLMGLSMNTVFDYSVSDDAQAVLEDFVMTIAPAEGARSELSQSMPDFEPMVIYVRAEMAPDYALSSARFDYEVEGDVFAMDMRYVETSGGNELEMHMAVTDVESGERYMAMDVEENEVRAADGALEYSAVGIMDVQDETHLALNLSGNHQADGAGSGRVDLDVVDEGEPFGLGFSYRYDAEPVEDIASGCENIYMIEDFDLDNLQALLVTDAHLVAAITKIGNAALADEEKLMASEDGQVLSELMEHLFAASYGGYGEGAYESDDYEPEDDGVLSFEEPVFTWLPEGWEETERTVDTAYDEVSVTLRGSDAGEFIFGHIYAHEDDMAETYILGEDGGLVPLEGRTVNVYVSPFMDIMVIGMTKDGMYIDLYVYAESLDLSAVGQILNGIVIAPQAPGA